jgi:hypothetical protein
VQCFGVGSVCSAHNNSQANFEPGWDLFHANSFKRAKDGSKRYFNAVKCVFIIRWILSLRYTNQVLILEEKYQPLYAIGGNVRNISNKNIFEFLNHEAYTAESR